MAFVASVVVTLVIGGGYVRDRQRTIAAARDRARSQARQVASVIDTELRRFQTVVTDVADDVNGGKVGRETLVARMRDAVDTTPQMSGLGAAFRPLAYDPDLRLYAPYYQRKGNDVELVQLDSLYDYTQGQNEWYQKPLKDGPSWSEPAVAAADAAAVVEYSVPFQLGAAAGAAPSGVIHGTMALAEINDMVSSVDLGEYGYGFLVSGGGFLISHPFSAEYAPERRASAPRGADADRMLRSIPAGARSAVEDGVDPVTGEPCWLFFEPVPSSSWTVGVVFFKGQVSQTRNLRRQQIRFAVALVVTACLLLALLLEPHRGPRDVLVLWTGSGIGSAILVIGIGWVWSVSYGAPLATPDSRDVFADKGSVRRFVLDSTRTSLRRTGTLPIFVPTGVFIQTLEIVSANNISMTAYVWQKYARNLPETVARAFVLPDAAEQTITEAYRRTDGETETIGWTVKATIRENFDYSRYPLDQQNFNLRIWHSDLDKGVVLVPDFDSYRIIHPLARAGLEKDFALPGWTVERTRFGSRARSETTTFGIGAGEDNTGTELSFDILINRRIIEPMFSDLLPLTVAAVMVFVMLLLVSEGTRTEVVSQMATYSGLFFIVILAELDLRGRIAGGSILYIEHFYFVMYGAILLSSLVTLSNGWPGLFPWVEKRDHFLSKLLFWPMILVTLSVTTLWVFY